MTQQELYEFVCKRCSHTSIFESEPPEGYECEICGPPPKEYVKYSKNYKIFPKPGWWRCENHHVTMKWNDSCIECSKKFTKRNFPDAGRIILPNLDDEKTKDEIEMSKTGAMMRNKVKENLLALQKAQLETPHLIKAQLKQQGQILKALERLNKNLEVKNEV